MCRPILQVLWLWGGSSTLLKSSTSRCASWLSVLMRTGVPWRNLWPPRDSWVLGRRRRARLDLRGLSRQLLERATSLQHMCVHSMLSNMCTCVGWSCCTRHEPTRIPTLAVHMYITLFTAHFHYVTSISSAPHAKSGCMTPYSKYLHTRIHYKSF